MFLLRFFHSFVAVDQFSIIYVTVIAVGVELVRNKHSRGRGTLSAWYDASARHKFILLLRGEDTTKRIQEYAYVGNGCIYLFQNRICLQLLFHHYSIGLRVRVRVIVSSDAVPHTMHSWILPPSSLLFWLCSFQAACSSLGIRFCAATWSVCREAQPLCSVCSLRLSRPSWMRWLSTTTASLAN